METVRTYARIYSRGVPHGNGADLQRALSRWCFERGLSYTVQAAISGPGYGVSIEGHMPRAEHIGAGSAYWYPEGATLSVDHREGLRTCAH